MSVSVPELNRIDQMMNDAVLILDDRFQVVEANPELQALLDQNMAALNGRLARDVFADLPELVMLLQRYQQGSPITTGEITLDHNAETRVFVAQIMPLTLAKSFRGHLLMLRDMTSERRSQQQIQERLEMLAVRNGELDAFNHTVAHELRAPLGLVAGYANLLLEIEKGNLSDLVAEYLDNIQNTALKMSDMIDALLVFAKYRESDEMLMSIIDVEPVVEAALERFRPEIDRRGIGVTVAPDLPRAVAYDLWLEEIFANLIGNAVKYIGSQNPDPRIVIRGKYEDGFARYEVEDNGLGLSPEEVDRVFQAFGRIPKDGVSGTGLGLSIVSRIVRRFNGQVGVESQVDVGSIFWFTLPRG